MILILLIYSWVLCISLERWLALFIWIKIFLFAFFAISIIGSVAQKSTWEGATGIKTKSAASIDGLASDSILGGVSIIIISWSCFKIFDSYWTPHKLAVLKVKLLFEIFFSW